MTPGERILRITATDGIERELLVVAPAGRVKALVIVFHPFGFDPPSVIDGERPGERLMRPLVGFRAPAHLHGLALVAPTGDGRATRGTSLAWRPYLDAVWDAARDLAEELQAPAIATAGLSMGGLEALVLAGQHPGEIEAVWAANPVIDVARWFDDIVGEPLQALLEVEADRTIELEVGGTPIEAPDAYRARSANTYVEQLVPARLQIVWSPIDNVVHDQAGSHAGAFAAGVRAAGGRVDERITTHVPPAWTSDPGRYAHQSADIWSAAAFLAGLDDRLE
jgi:pimeloyl-ACP methyl ester carboxylesterase